MTIEGSGAAEEIVLGAWCAMVEWNETAERALTVEVSAAVKGNVTADGRGV